MQRHQWFTYRQTLPWPLFSLFLFDLMQPLMPSKSGLCSVAFAWLWHAVAKVSAEKQYQLCSLSPPALILWCVDLLRVPGDSTRLWSLSGQRGHLGGKEPKNQRQTQKEGEFGRDVAQETMQGYHGDKLSLQSFSLLEGDREKRGEGERKGVGGGKGADIITGK